MYRECKLHYGEHGLELECPAEVPEECHKVAHADGHDAGVSGKALCIKTANGRCQEVADHYAAGWTLGIEKGTLIAVHKARNKMEGNKIG